MWQIQILLLVTFVFSQGLAVDLNLPINGIESNSRKVKSQNAGVRVYGMGQGGRTSVIFRKSTQIVNHVNLYEVRAGETITLSCNVIADDLDVNTVWSKLNPRSKIDVLNDSRFTKLDNHSLTITNVMPSDSGGYVCAAYTKLDEASDTIKLQVLDVPNMPEINDFHCHNMNAQIRWKSTGDNFAPIRYYTIKKRTTTNDWEFYRVVSDTNILKISLTPWTNNSFRVIAHNKFGESIPSEPTEICSTNADYPNKNPEDVKGGGDEPLNLVISWEVMPPIEHYGPGFYYMVSWKRENVDEPWNFLRINDWKQNNYTIPNQSQFACYRFKLEASNDIGRSTVKPKEVIAFSPEGTPTEAPTNLTVTYTNCTSVTLRWNAVPEESVNGHFKAYAIQIWNYIDDEKYMREMYVDNGTTEITISELIPDVLTKAHISVKNSLYQGPASNVIEIAKEFYRQNFSTDPTDTNKNEIDDENDREPGNSMDFLKLLILCVALSCVAAWLFKIIFCKLQANKKNEVSNPPSYPSLSSTRNPFTRSQNQYV